MYTPSTDADYGWLRDVRHVYDNGMFHSPRGMGTFEILGMTSTIPMKYPIIMNPTRKLGYKFMAAEAAWMIEGRNDVASISKYSKKISDFSDDGETFFGAYGPRLHQQLGSVIGVLSRDPDTRQAVVSTWRPNPPPTKDVPCTLSWQFLIRGNKLHCIATMRSSDLWLGHPYDIFNFSAISFYVMMCVNKFRSNEKLELGNLILTAGSKHLYQRNVEEVRAVLEQWTIDEYKLVRQMEPCFIEERYTDPNEFVTHLWDCADSSDGAKSLIQVR